MSTPELAVGLAADLTPFADLGTGAPIVEASQPRPVIRMVRKGIPTEIEVNLGTGALIERAGEATIPHISAKALLASERYGDLRTWVARQAALYGELDDAERLIEVNGFLNKGIQSFGVDEIDSTLASAQPPSTARVLLIDGPAGIGKTYFIKSLTQKRAAEYLKHQRSLILHVESRGKALSFLYDLIAFSLQRLRLEVTFDQVPILAKYGLVTLAIDGFDELADPDGYGMAWHQVSDLVSAIRGQGTMILAGRETFIGRDRLLRDVKSLRPEVDDISVLTLKPPSKGEAMRWLSEEGWGKEELDIIEGFLEPSSLALRPFFLRTLADPSIASGIESATSSNVLSILVEAMVEREAEKFGDNVERELGSDKRKSYVRTLMCEVARDMAENGTASVSDATLFWLAEYALPEPVSNEVLGAIKHRAPVIAFLTNDERPGYKRFYHEKFLEYFLAQVVIDSIADRSQIKAVARGLFASSFLETLGALVASGVPEDRAKAYLEGGVELLSSPLALERTKRNIGAFLIASLSAAELVGGFTLVNTETDEVRFTGTAASARMQNVVISQFDCRGGDLSSVHFEGCTILSVIADEATLLPESFPLPNVVQDVAGEGGNIVDPTEIAAWKEAHLKNAPPADNGLIPQDLRGHEAIRLIHKACRLRQYWLRRHEDVYAARILDHSCWPLIEQALQDNDLLREERRQAAGTDSRFLHIKQADDILAENSDSDNVVGFYRDLCKSIRAIP